MALNIGSKIYRNMQEQVAENGKDILKIYQILDGLNVQDNVITIDSFPYTLTEEELKVVNQPVAFIIYNNNLYIKKEENSGILYFDIVFSVSQSTVLSFSTYEISITKASGYATISINNYETYNTTQIDTKLADKANLTYVNSQLALKASLAGANFTGGISAPEIIENMSGYSITQKTIENMEINPIYGGIVKNGNKLTCIYFAKITRRDTASYGSICSFNIPAEVANKLYPTQLGVVVNSLGPKVVGAYSSQNSKVDLNSIAIKGTNSFELFLYGLASLVVDTEYQIRYEVTFLLSDNLAS